MDQSPSLLEAEGPSEDPSAQQFYGFYDAESRRAMFWPPDSETIEEQIQTQEAFFERYEQLSGEPVPQVARTASGGAKLMTTSPKDSSARMVHPPTHARFSPPVAVVSETTEKPPVAVRFPEISGVKWEWKEQGTIAEAWHCPSGARDRENSTYLGRLGKKKLLELAGKSPAEIEAFTREWIETKRAGKGIQ